MLMMRVPFVGLLSGEISGLMMRVPFVGLLSGEISGKL